MFLPAVKKLAEDCCKYGNNNQNLGFVLGRASVEFGKSHSQMEIEREKLLKVLGEQVMAISTPSFTISQVSQHHKCFLHALCFFVENTWSWFILPFTLLR
jgi:hypothetical protein